MKEQIELIRKDLNSLYEYRQDNWNYTGCHNNIVRHLNSMEEMSQNILKYKNAWEELKNGFEKREEGWLNWEDQSYIASRFSNLEKKHGIEVE